MIITINVEDTAKSLADEKLRTTCRATNKSKSQEQISSILFTEDENGEIIYTPDAQEVFDEYYGEYKELLLKKEV